MSRRVLPGFKISISFTLLYLSLMVFIPLVAVFMKATELSWDEFASVVWNDRAKAAYFLTFGAAFVGSLVNVIVGVLLAWVLVRYEFPGKRLFDSLIDLPFALPTAVAGLVYSSLYVKSGWLGRFLVPMGIEVAYTPLGVILMLVFIGLPFVVRTVEPVLESLDAETEEAAQLLGASRWQVFTRIVIPTLLPSAITGFALAFARAIGEYGSVVFISGNIRFKTEIASMLIVSHLEAFEYREATAIAVVMLVIAFVLLVAINFLERWSKRHYA